MQAFWYGGLPPQKITGNRLVVFYDMIATEFHSIIRGKRVRYFDLHEARVTAEKRGYDDGLHIKVSRGYGLKPRVDALAGSAAPKTKKKKRGRK